MRIPRPYLSSEEGSNHEKFLYWAKLARRVYGVGLLALLIGLALVVALQHFAGIQDYFRVVAVIVIGLACLGHVLWARLDGWLRSP